MIDLIWQITLFIITSYEITQYSDQIKPLLHIISILFYVQIVYIYLFLYAIPSIFDNQTIKLLFPFN